MRVLKWIGMVVGALLLVALVAAGVIYFLGGRALASTTDPTTSVRTLTVPTDAAAIARGEHLVQHVNLCVDCHGDLLQGTAFIDDPALGVIPAPNLTSGTGGIGGQMTDARWINALTEGIGHDGRHLLIMPVVHYHAMNDADLGAVIAYLKQLPPQENDAGTRNVGPLGHALVALGALPFQSDVAATLPPPETVPPAADAAYGNYMMVIAGCQGCHGENLAGGTDPNAPKGPNITTALLGTWSEDQFVNFMHTGTLPSGGNVSDEMPWKKYAAMDETELKALYAYLQTTEALPNNP